MRLGVILALVAAVGGAGVALERAGYARGYAAAQAAHAAAQAALEDKLANRDAALRAAVVELDAARATRAALVERIENEALADDGADRPAFTGDGVRRLGDRWRRAID